MTPIHLEITLKEYLEQVGISAYTLGKWTHGISAQSVYAIANGTRKPSLEALEAIINAFRENGLETTLEDLVKVKQR
jgi:transcriptional regulator with XRE-family HTH domain